MKIKRLLPHILIISVSATTAQAKETYSPAVYDGTDTAVLRNVDSLEECVALVREKSQPEERKKLKFKKDPFEDKMPDFFKQKAAEMREGQLGGCSGEDGYYIVTETTVEKRPGPKVYMEE